MVVQCKGYENIATIIGSCEICFEHMVMYLNSDTDSEKQRCIESSHYKLLECNPDTMTPYPDLDKRVSKKMCEMWIDFNIWIRRMVVKMKEVKSEDDHVNLLGEYSFGLSKYFFLVGSTIGHFR